MRLPNGFGSVYKLTGHRRRPWVVKKTIDGRQKALGYFETHDAALTFLLKVNHEPHGLTATFADIYQQWQASKWPTISKSSQQAYDISFRHLSRLHDKTMSRLKYLDLQAAMDDVRQVAGYSTQKKCRVLMSQLYQYAIKREMATTAGTIASIINFRISSTVAILISRKKLLIFSAHQSQSRDTSPEHQ